VRHTRIALMSAEGISNQFIAERCGVNVPTIKRLAAQLKTGQNWHFDPAKWAACRLLRNPWSSIGDHQEEQPNY
jgi:transposase